MRSIAVPLDADAWRAIRADAELWAIAAQHPPFVRARSAAPLPEISAALCATAEPGARWAEHFADRSFDQAEYLLDPSAYRSASSWEEREREVAHRVIQGDEVFARHASSGQGLAWRCSTFAFLVTAVEEIDTLPVDARRREFSVAEMVHLGVYKAHAGEGDDQCFARVLAALRAFRDHCRDVIAHGLDLLIEVY